MKGIGALALACALALGAVSPSLAHGRQDGPEGRLGTGGGDFGIMRLVNLRALDKLDLSDSQRDQVRKLLDEIRGERRGHKDDSMRGVMRDLRDGREPTAAEKKKLADEMAGRVLDGTRALARLHAILTPEQRALVQARLDRAGEFEGRGRRFADERVKEGRPGQKGEFEGRGKQQPGMQGREGRPGFPMGRFTERLNLTEEQENRAEVLFKAWEKPTEARQNEMGRLGKEMGKRAFLANPDTRRLEADAKKLAELAVDGISERARHMEQFRSMLTDEQKKMLDDRPMKRNPGKRPW
jgi:Spy/CpxP family protein refolding chaperone